MYLKSRLSEGEDTMLPFYLVMSLLSVDNGVLVACICRATQLLEIIISQTSLCSSFSVGCARNIVSIRMANLAVSELKQLATVYH